jgi:predicted MFS family arabinose efflux permease
MLFALNRGPEWGWSSPSVVAGFVFAPLAFSLFLWWERRTSNPLIRLDYFSRRNFASPIATQFFLNFAYMGGFILTPLFLAEAFGYGETRIGLLSIARPLTFSIVAPIGGYLAVRVGERSTGVFGAVAVTLSMVALAMLEPGMTDLFVIGALALSGVGLGASSPSMAAMVANSVDEDDLGIAVATQQLGTLVGRVAGIQLMQTVQVSRAPDVGLVASYHEAYLLGAVVCVLGVVTATFVRSSSRELDETVAVRAGEAVTAPS